MLMMCFGLCLTINWGAIYHNLIIMYFVPLYGAIVVSSSHHDMDTLKNQMMDWTQIQLVCDGVSEWS